MKIAYKNPRTTRCALLVTLLGALAGLALAGSTDNCDTEYPQCPDDVVLGSPVKSDCNNTTIDSVRGPVPFLLMTCESHSSACGSADGCNTLNYRNAQADLVDCDRTYFCISRGTSPDAPSPTGRYCTYPYAACPGVTNPPPLPSPIYPPYNPPNTPLP